MLAVRIQDVTPKVVVSASCGIEVARVIELLEPDVLGGTLRALAFPKLMHWDAMLEDDRVFLLGEDIGVFGGAFGVTKGMLESYAELKWQEVYMFEHTPHPVEYAMYYSC